MNPYIQYMYSYPHKTAYRPMQKRRLADYARCLTGDGHGLYFHIPFCQAKCGYCNLFSVTGQSEEAMERYLDAAERQCMQYREVTDPARTRFSELVVGGGTPLLLTGRQLRRMFGMIESRFDFSEGRELVIETAPNQTTEEKLSLLKEAGVTRVSMGIQSFSEKELRTLGRQHDAARAREALGRLKETGFPCVNVDFIYGVPGQTVESLLASLQEALRYEPDEIFLYPLYVKHGAYLTYTGVTPDAALARMQYREASAFLKQAGFRQDSMRRFVRGAAGSREFSECGFGNSLALGCGGRSYLGRLHFCSPYAITQKDCLARLREYEETEDFTVISHGILLSEEEQKRRYVIRHLLIWPGIDTGRYEELFHKAVWEDFPVLHEWEAQGYLTRRETKRTKPDAGAPENPLPGENPDGVRNAGMNPCTGAAPGGRVTWLALTEAGMELSDYLGPQLISDDVRRAMEEWEKEAGCESSHDNLQR